MAFPSTLLWIVSVMTLLSTVCSNVVFDEDPLQPVTSDETVSVGGAVTLTCRVAESDNSSLQWSNTVQQTLYFGEKRALRDNRIQLHRSTPTELSIIISEVQLSDEGEYTCSIFTMPVRTARATVTVLGVPDKPHISGLENPVQEGGTLILTCTSTGSKPPARLRWFRGDLEVQGRPDVVESVPDEPTYNVSSELTLEVSRADDNQVVTCAVDHPSLTPGDKRSDQVLQVLYSPNVEIAPESDLPREGEKFHLECLGNSNPEPSSYIWEKKDGELPPLAKAEGNLLRFEALNKSDNGVYLCFADNGIGSSVGEYVLLVQDPSESTSAPPTPTFSSLVTDATSSPPELSSTGSPSESPPTTNVASAATTALSTDLYPDLSDSSATLAPSSPSSTNVASAATTAVSTDLYPLSDSSATLAPSSPSSTNVASAATTVLSNDLFPDLTDSSATLLPSSLTPSVVSDEPNGRGTPTDGAENIADPTAMSTSSSVDHAVIGGVVAVIVFILLCLLIVFGRYLIRHKGTYLTHEAKGSDDAPDADTAIINAEGGNSGAEDKKEYFI
ncbi:cell adhesion molecule 3 isoform X2 [Syngnathus acus]|uniref:cell adhesion molecule 3 isoform X2 n=1 Tax=Syngnathus acus TaxID=161584 RepID=UPI0018864FD2|nr:cell adhesion molecule 3 isoform X2 [Syngnathus acus]